jgi:hypothetical protein
MFFFSTSNVIIVAKWVNIEYRIRVLKFFFNSEVCGFNIGAIQGGKEGSFASAGLWVHFSAPASRCKTFFWVHLHLVHFGVQQEKNCVQKYTRLNANGVLHTYSSSRSHQRCGRRRASLSTLQKQHTRRVSVCYGGAGFLYAMVVRHALTRGRRTRPLTFVRSDAVLH